MIRVVLADPPYGYSSILSDYEVIEPDNNTRTWQGTRRLAHDHSSPLVRYEVTRQRQLQIWLSTICVFVWLAAPIH